VRTHTSASEVHSHVFQGGGKNECLKYKARSSEVRISASAARSRLQARGGEGTLGVRESSTLGVCESTQVTYLRRT